MKHEGATKDRAEKRINKLAVGFWFIFLLFWLLLIWVVLYSGLSMGLSR